MIVYEEELCYDILGVLKLNTNIRPKPDWTLNELERGNFTRRKIDMEIENTYILILNNSSTDGLID